MSCIQFKRTLAGWNNLAEELTLLSSIENTKAISSNRFSQLPRWCLIKELCPALDELSGLKLHSVSAAHELSNLDERERAINAIREVAQNTYFAFILERRSIRFRSSELKRADSLVLTMGWTRDSERKYDGFFWGADISCTPHGAPGRYYQAFWREVITLGELKGSVEIEATDNSWLARPGPTTLLKCMAGGGKGENPKALSFYQHKRLDEVRILLDRFDSMGELRSRSISCNIIGDHYERARAVLNNIGPCWKISPSCDLLPEDVELMKQGKEPTVTHLPGASYTWQAPGKDGPQCNFTCGFHKVHGQWHSVIGASYSSPDAAHSLAHLLLAHGYVQTFPTGDINQ